MKKVLVLALSLMLGGAAAQAQSTPAAATQAAGPQIQFAEMKYDFGVIKPGDVVDHTFTFKNIGTAPLVISNIQASCGCTTPEWTREPVMPGKTGTITAKFNSAGKMGMQNKVLTIDSNSASGQVMVSLVGEIREGGATTAAAANPAKTEVTAPADANVKQKTKMGDAKIKAKHKKNS
ncbi:DUF1573 domain-containing protein [Hymenobacter lutimineralis]|uniref:DUF1573 domain-containing protein n=1 Tax=Hymenobacter lutimineralis TaxID=2606448 RepID=A0A5D6UVW8_9BACT|nr:DUF1573 domain-containing protein [Hymenobacter lutimineralis]TYZ06534.1 DUF1573 domain-containing protein [Hymenobacter lutimineralis]